MVTFWTTRVSGLIQSVVDYRQDSEHQTLDCENRSPFREWHHIIVRRTARNSVFSLVLMGFSTSRRQTFGGRCASPMSSHDGRRKMIEREAGNAPAGRDSPSGPGGGWNRVSTGRKSIQSSVAFPGESDNEECASLLGAEPHPEPRAVQRQIGAPPGRRAGRGHSTSGAGDERGGKGGARPPPSLRMPWDESDAERRSEFGSTCTGRRRS